MELNARRRVAYLQISEGGQATDRRLLIVETQHTAEAEIAQLPGDTDWTGVEAVEVRHNGAKGSVFVAQAERRTVRGKQSRSGSAGRPNQYLACLHPERVPARLAIKHLNLAFDHRDTKAAFILPDSEDSADVDYAFAGDDKLDRPRRIVMDGHDDLALM